MMIVPVLVKFPANSESFRDFTRNTHSRPRKNANSEGMTVKRPRFATMTRIAEWMLRPPTNPSRQTSARSVGLCTLPDAVRGNSMINDILVGHLNAAKLARQCPIITASLTVRPAFGTTKARPTSRNPGWSAAWWFLQESSQLERHIVVLAAGSELEGAGHRAGERGEATLSMPYVKRRSSASKRADRTWWR